jgi:hypothetical protein
MSGPPKRLPGTQPVSDGAFVFESIGATAVCYLEFLLAFPRAASHAAAVSSVLQNVPVP